MFSNAYIEKNTEASGTRSTEKDGAGRFSTVWKKWGMRFSIVWKTGCGGFTLLELLVVMTVVLLLAAVAVGGFSRARAMAQEAACKGNLRAWGAAFYGFAADHRGYLPHSDNWTRGDKASAGSTPMVPGLEGSPHDHSYVDELPPYMGWKAWRDFEEGEKPMVGPWQCPAARRGKDTEYNYRPSREGGFSYAMNSYLSYDFAYGGLPAQGSYLNTARVEEPARTILMFEQAAHPTEGLYGKRYPSREAGRHPGEDVTALTVRHRRWAGGEGANFLFLDGHVERRDDVWVRQHSDVPKRGDLEWWAYRF